MLGGGEHRANQAGRESFTFNIIILMASLKLGMILPN